MKRIILSERLRRAVLKCGLSQAELARRSGLAESIISRFRREKSGMTLSAIDKLAEALGLELRPKKKGR